LYIWIVVFANFTLPEQFPSIKLSEKLIDCGDIGFVFVRKLHFELLPLKTGFSFYQLIDLILYCFKVNFCAFLWQGSGLLKQR
jgi:hypothetical protein